MTATKKRIVKFAPKGMPSFYDTVRERVENYFREQNLDRHANAKMYIKTAVMLSLYFVPYFFIVTGAGAASPFLFYGLWGLMGLGIVGIGTSVMHDSNHGSYASNKFVNNALGGILNMLGGYAHNWRIQHNILHHTYTNLDGLDEDIDAGKLLRMCPHKPHYPFHRFQHIYAWALYCIMNLYWISVKDFRLLLRYHRNDLLRKEKISLGRGITELSLLKIFYAGYMLVLPAVFSGMPWYSVLIGFVIMHILAGLALACIFQPAHVMETSDFSAPSEEMKMQHSWAVHQIRNTTNFSPNSKFISWFIGGLNYQIEHHLFPHVCHVHYPVISGIVKQTAMEYGLPYNVQPTFAHALWEHGRMLRKLGEKQ